MAIENVLFSVLFFFGGGLLSILITCTILNVCDRKSGNLDDSLSESGNSTETTKESPKKHCVTVTLTTADIDNEKAREAGY